MMQAPNISGKTIILYHAEHHRTYVDSFNTTEGTYAETSMLNARIKLQVASK